jgi:hypothetical protein
MIHVARKVSKTVHHIRRFLGWITADLDPLWCTPPRTTPRDGDRLWRDRFDLSQIPKIIERFDHRHVRASVVDGTHEIDRGTGIQCM